MKSPLRSSVAVLLLAVIAAGEVHAATTASRPLPSADPVTTHDPALYLFADDHWVAERVNLVRVMKQPQVLPSPIIRPDEPRTERDCAWGNVIREPDGRFRLWYTTMMMGHAAGGGHEMARAGVWGRGEDFSFHPRSAADVRETECMLGKYAESADGIHWTRPRLGLIEFRGNRANNIVLTGEQASGQTDGALTNFDGFTVVRDDAEPDPQKRYKMVAHWESVHFWDPSEPSGRLERPESRMTKYRKARGKYITFSPDGLHWDQLLVRLNADGQGDRCLVVRDHRDGRWWLNNRPATAYEAAGLATSTDLIHWTPTEPHLFRDSEAHPQVESLIPFNYGNQDLGFLITQVKGKMMLSYLVSHHDGEPWKRIGRVPDEPFVAPGPPGTYYATGAVPLHNEPIVVGDEMLICFNAFAYNQQPPCPDGSRSIGVARMRRDAFVGLTCGSGQDAPTAGEGYLLTRPVKVAAKRLLLNIEQRGQGASARVSLHGPDGGEIRGFGVGDSLPIIAGSVREAVTWRNRSDAREILGREVMVRIALTGRAVVYAFRWAE
jgi:hypothetical protein